jgi:tetratricopeptide (TPR) repeat protein
VLLKVLSWHAPSEGSFWSIGRSWLHAGQPAEALANFEQESSAGLREMGMIMALHDLGRMDEFEERFAGLRDNDADAESIARIYSWVGNNDKAFEWLDKMIAADGLDSLQRAQGEFYENITSDPRWRVLRDKYGYEDEPVEAIEFNYSLPPGVALD